MKLVDLKKEIKNYLQEKDLKLYDVSYDNKENILSIILDESLDMQNLENLSNELSNFMDKYDKDFDKYILDVSNIGLERPIKTKKDKEKAIGSYIYLKTNKDEYYGTLDNYDADMISLTFKEKGKNKKIDISDKDVKEMRYAVKF